MRSNVVVTSSLYLKQNGDCVLNCSECNVIKFGKNI